MSVQPMRRVEHLVVTLSCGHKVRLDRVLRRLAVVPMALPCVDCDPVPAARERKHMDGSKPALRLVGGAR